MEERDVVEDNVVGDFEEDESTTEEAVVVDIILDNIVDVDASAVVDVSCGVKRLNRF